MTVTLTLERDTAEWLLGIMRPPDSWGTRDHAPKLRAVLEAALAAAEPAGGADSLEKAAAECAAAGLDFELYGSPILTTDGERFGEYEAWVNGIQGDAADTPGLALRRAIEAMQAARGEGR